MLLPNILHVSKIVAEGQHLSACVVISLCGYQPVWLGKHRRRAVETKQTRAHNKTCTSEVRSWLKRACYSPCGWKSPANHLHKHEQILRSLQNMPSSVESIKGQNRTHFVAAFLCCLVCWMAATAAAGTSCLAILAMSTSISSALVTSGVTSLLSALHLNLCVSVIVSKEAHLSRADILLLQKPTAAYCRVPKH